MNPSRKKNPNTVTLSVRMTGYIYKPPSPEQNSAHRKLYTVFISVPPTPPPVVKITSNFTDYFTITKQRESNIHIQLSRHVNSHFLLLVSELRDRVPTHKIKCHNDPDWKNPQSAAGVAAPMTSLLASVHVCVDELRYFVLAN